MAKNNKKGPIREEEQAPLLLFSLRSRMPAIGDAGEAIDKITAWINQEGQLVSRNHHYQSSIKLEVKYNEPLSLVITDTILRLLGTRILTEAERKDPNRQENIIVRGTSRPNIHLYVKYSRPKANLPLEEEYILIASKELVFPDQIKHEVPIETLPVEPIPRVVEKKHVHHKAKPEPAAEKVTEDKEKPVETEEVDPPRQAKADREVEDPEQSRRVEGEKELIYQKLKELEEKQNELHRLADQAKEKRELEEVADPEQSRRIEEKIEKKVKESLEKEKVTAQKAPLPPTEVGAPAPKEIKEPKKEALEVERLADKLAEEEKVPSPSPKKKSPGILSILNDLLIGEEEE